MIVLDISCPSCEQVESVRKRGLGTYHCTACGRTFSAEHVA